MRHYLPAQPGVIRTTDGAAIGQHQGAAYYTLGQREGLGIGGVRGTPEGPWFVVAKDIDDNELIVAQEHEHPLLMSTTLIADSPIWISGAAPKMPLHCCAKIRYRQRDQECTVNVSGEDSVEVRFAEPQRAVNPGQSVVFYDGANCLGGGIIDRTV
jgi:tRNA-specific 2-thiouridylase